MKTKDINAFVEKLTPEEVEDYLNLFKSAREEEDSEDKDYLDF